MIEIVKKVLILGLFSLFLTCTSGKETIRATFIEPTEPERLDPEILSAVELYHNKQLDKAQFAFDNLIIKNPTDWRSYYYLGLINLESDHFLQSEQFFFTALKYVSHNKVERAKIYKSLGDLYEAQNKTASAKINYLTAYKLDPNSNAIQTAAQKYQLVSSTK